LVDSVGQSLQVLLLFVDFDIENHDGLGYDFLFLLSLHNDGFLDGNLRYIFVPEKVNLFRDFFLNGLLLKLGDGVGLAFGGTVAIVHQTVALILFGHERGH